MKTDCNDRERILREQEPAELAALERHAANCAACADEVRLWKEISAAAHSLHKEWPSPGLWPQIHQALAAQADAAAHEPRGWSLGRLWQNVAPRWQVAAAALALLVISASGAWMLVRRPAPVPPDTAKRLLTDQALHDVEQNEAAYIQSIDKLSALAESKLESTASPLMASYKEKLLLIDAAIADCRANIEQNRQNAHLRQELLSIYREKQRTLQEVLREE